MNRYISTLLHTSLAVITSTLFADRIPLVDASATLELPGSDSISFVLQHNQGDIFITGQESDELRVELSEDDNELFPSYLDWNEDESTVRLDVGKAPMNRNVNVWLPQGSQINLQAVGSNITVDNIHGEAVIRLVNGNIHLEGASSAVLIECVNGNTEVIPAPSESMEPMSIMSQNGSIRLVVTEDFKGSANVSTIAGKVFCDLPDSTTANPASSRWNKLNLGPITRKTIPINEGGRPITLNTVNGNIHIEIR